MIYNSAYWKNDLQKHAHFLSKKLDQKKWHESSFARLEQSIMLGCYTIRKLAEAKKVADSFYNKSINLKYFDAKGSVVDFLNWHNIDRLYLLDKPKNIQKKLSYIINQFIHSFVFAPIFKTKNRINGIAFNSDLTKTNSLYYLDIIQLVNIFMEASGFDANKISFFRISETGNLEVISE